MFASYLTPGGGPPKNHFWGFSGRVILKFLKKALPAKKNALRQVYDPMGSYDNGVLRYDRT